MIHMKHTKSSTVPSAVLAVTIKRGIVITLLTISLLIGFVSGQEQNDKLQYGNQLSTTDNTESTNDEASMVTPKVDQLHFVEIQGATFLKYFDLDKNRNVLSKVPRYFEHLSDDRIAKEVEYHNSVLDGKGWSERVVLELFYYYVTYGTDHKPKEDAQDDDFWTEQEQQQTRGLEGAHNWLNEDVSVCRWEGITCGITTTGAFEGKQNSGSTGNGKKDSITVFLNTDLDGADFVPPVNRVTKIDLVGYKLPGILPEELYQMEFLVRLNVNDNHLHSTIPTTFGLFTHLAFMDLGVNRLSGTIPTEMALLSSTLDELWLEKNRLFASSFPMHLMKLSRLEFFDISGNEIYGKIPTEIGRLTKLESLFLEENAITGTIISELGCLTRLKVLDLGFNHFTGTLPTELGRCTSLVDMNVVSNAGLYGALPTELFLLSNLEAMLLSENDFSGRLPSSTEAYRSSEVQSINDIPVYGWSNLRSLLALAIDRNRFTGSLPPDMLAGVGPTLTALDIGYNVFTGTIPKDIGSLTKLERITAPKNLLFGQLPQEFGDLPNLSQINLTGNLFTGTVPPALCDTTNFDSELVKEFGCDAILCPAGKFHPDGAASLYGGCVPCPDPDHIWNGISFSRILGRTACSSAEYRVGDVNGDGIVSVREALRVLYVETGEENWGDEFHAWHDLGVRTCNLPGVTCVGGELAKIDLTEAGMCSDGEGKEGRKEECFGLPAELGLLTSLEVLVMSNRLFLRSTIPTEIGLMSNLKLLDLSNCPKLYGPLPSELGLLTNLRVLNIQSSNLNGTIPTELFTLRNLEKLNLSANHFTGTLSTNIGMLGSIREMLISRSALTGTVPEETGSLSNLENLELYSNQLSGQIPDTMGNCESLKRIDFFNNRFSGTIPPSFGRMAMLQILHLKKNHLTGTIPGSIGALPYLSWVDVASNYLEGTIPSSLGSSQTLKDLRLGSNRLYDPVPFSLCSNTRVNGGLTKDFGCDAVICPLGTYSESGYATEKECTGCPAGETTIYLGSSSCIKLSSKDLLSMFFDVMRGENWPEEHQKGWKDKDLSPCQWSGVSCDENGEITGLSFPVAGSDI